jgi:predicted transposase/invertase (TIGR01784 family)
LAEVINLSPEDMNLYQQSLKIKRDNYSALESAELRGEQRGQKQGIEIGQKQGMEIGAEQEKREMAVKLKTKGMHVEEIAELTNLSIAEIQTLVEG